MLWVRRFLGLCHFVWGAVLLSGVAWTFVSAFRVLPHMSTGTIWTNLPGTVMLAAAQGLPFAVLGLWMVTLGRRLWSGHSRLRAALLWTHGILLVLGCMAIVVGIHAMDAAGRSSAHGGGLLSPIAVIPLLFGVPVTVLAICSITVALTAIPRRQSVVNRDSDH